MDAIIHCTLLQIDIYVKYAFSLNNVNIHYLCKRFLSNKCFQEYWFVRVFISQHESALSAVTRLLLWKSTIT